MEKWLSQGLAQVTPFWGSLTRSQKIKMGAIFLFSAVAMGLLMTYALRIEYASVFSKLSEQDAGEITKKLADLKIASKVTSSSDGTITVLVPTAKALDARLQLASAGLPSGSVVGLEGMDKLPITTSEQQRKAQYQRFLQGELERTFSRLNGVATVKVILTLPDAPVFLKDKRDPSAAIVMALKPGVQLDASQIKGVIYLAAHSVEGLKPENVTLTDGYGRPLYDSSAGPGREIGAQKDQEQAIRRNLEQSVQSLLEQIFGLGNAVTRVNVLMDFDQTQEQSRTYNLKPGSREGIVSTILKATESVKGQTAGTAPGTSSNIPGSAAVIPQSGGQNSSEKSSEEIKYLVDEINKTVARAPQIKDLTVTVTLNTKKIKLDDQLSQTVREMVVNATGANQQKVSVAGFDFMPLIDPADLAEAKAQVQREKLFTMVSIPAIILLAGFVLFRLFASWQRRKREEDELPRHPAATQEVKLPERQLNQDERRRMKVQEELGKIARDKPEDFAQLLKAWLDEE